jgi:c-di-GMP-binding flagellar brake protein YcgR
MMMRFPVACARLGRAGEPVEEFEAETVDLSAGGIRFVTERSLTVGERLRLELRLGESNGTLEAEAHVVRLESTHDGRAVCALAFDQLDSAAERRVVGAVFAEERRAAEARSRVRLSLWLPVICRMPRLSEPVRARTVDLTADEVRLLTAARFIPGDRVELEIHGAEETFELTTKALVTQVDDEEDGRQIATLRFDRLDRATRASVLQFAFAEERRQADRRLLEGP